MRSEAAGSRPTPRTRRGTFEAAGDAAFSFGGADVWRMLITWAGVPCAYLELPDPGATSDPALSEGTLRRAAVDARRRERQVAELVARMGLREPVATRPTCTIVLCTRRRPRLAARALDAIASLDPPADEVVVVDNDPGDLDCREAAEAAGARYVVERRRGQNWARATGLAAARCELVAFTDDDVVVSPVWLAPLGRLFADPGVGAATGISVGLRLDTPAQNLRESIAGLIPNLVPRRFDWTNLAPVGSGRTGAGANMVFRRSLLLQLGDVFPPDLEVGTRAGSGGDLYVLYRVLAAGRRIELDPALYAQHEHPPELDALRSTVISYGTGFSAFLTKVLVEHKELPALTLWWWLVERYVQALVHRLVTGSRAELDLRRDYLRGGLLGGAGWVQARRDQRGRARPEPHGTAVPADPAPVPGVALLVDDSAADRNEAARGAEGDILLFLGRGVRAARDLAERHQARHLVLGGPGIVVGRTDPDAASAGLAAQHEALARFDLMRDREWAVSLTYTDVTGENLSIARELFERLGGFDPALSRETAARELGLRALAAGFPIVYEPSAIAVETLSFPAIAGLEAARRAGADDARIARLHQAASPLGACSSVRRRGVVPTRAALLLADTLEHARLRGAWLSVYRRLASSAYSSGRNASPRGAPRPVREIDLAAQERVEPAESPAPYLALRIGEAAAGNVKPPHGRWSVGLAEAAIDALDLKAARELDRLRHPWHPPPMAGLDGVLVVHGPAQAALAGEHAAELIAAGARLETLDGHPREHWDLVADCIACAPEPVVALPLPGARGGASWLQTAVTPLQGPNIAAVVGAGLREGAMPAPTLLVARHPHDGLYVDVGRAAQFMVLSTQMTAELGGLDPSAAAFGAHGPMLDLLHRALRSGMVVAYQETPGIDPPGAESSVARRLELERALARGGLVARDGLQRGGAAGAWVVAVHVGLRPGAVLWRALRFGSPSPRFALGSAAGHALGGARALATAGRWRSRTRRSPQPRSGPRVI